MTIDWSKPIEAVHEDGRVVPMALGDPQMNAFGPVRTIASPEEEVTNNFWYRDGGDYCAARTGWRIRNVPEHPTPTQYAPEKPGSGIGPAGGDNGGNARVSPDPAYAPELVESLVAEARALAAVPPQLVGIGVGAIVGRIRAIVSDLPQEVDPDLIEARDCVVRAYEAAGRKDLAIIAASGKMDGRLRVQAALLAIARGRQLQRGEAA